MKIITTIYVGQKVQKKGSKVIWTVIGNNEFANGLNGRVRINDIPTEVYLETLPKNRKVTMNKWHDIEQFTRDWVEV